jgi:hypothetical protein
MLNRIVSALCFATFAVPALGIELSSAPQEAVVNFTADNPRAMLEVLSAESTITTGPTFLAPSARASIWKPLCYAPCRVSVHLVDELRVGGDGIPASGSVLIDPGVSEMSLHATTGSSSTRVAAIVLFVAGGGAFAAGGSLLFMGAVEPWASQLMPVGAVTMGSGLALVVLGAVLNGLGSTSLQVKGGHEGSRSQLAW